jgi:eukaryotic-like serine/threonine-protein kinase
MQVHEIFTYRADQIYPAGVDFPNLHARSFRYAPVTVQTTLEPGPSTERVLRLCEGTSYQPLKLLGRGGIGQIYIVRHVKLEKLFALKLLHPHHDNSPTLAHRMRIEAQAMARLAHPNVVSVVDFWGADDGAPCFVMELLTGRNVGDEIRERRCLTASEVVDIGCQALAALLAAHEIGIVHRDIKPENLFLHEPRGQPRILKVLDFGIARIIADVSEFTPESLAKPTRSGTRIGSPRFMSPEGARGERVDHRADIYSLGLTLYVALVGSGPFDAGPVEVVPAPSKAGAQNVPPDLDAIVLRAIRPDRDERYQSAREFLQALAKLQPARRNHSPWAPRR